MIYHGNCHCGRYRFDLHVDENTDDKKLIPTVTCTCAACTKLGCLWHVVKSGHLVATTDTSDRNSATDDRIDETPPSPASWTSSSPLLTTYRSGLVHYEFCSVCGTGLFATHVKGTLAGQRLVNLRALLGLDPFLYVPEGGASSDRPDSPATPSSLESESTTASPNTLPSTGACLCGSVTVELLEPLASMPLKEDNCSICTRNAWLGAYPCHAQVVVRGAAQHTRDYRFGPRRYMGHPFCTTCGAHVFMNVYGPPAEVVARLSPAKQALVRQNLDVMPVNVRVLDRIRRHLGSLAVARSHEGTDGYERDVLGKTSG